MFSHSRSGVDVVELHFDVLLNQLLRFFILLHIVLNVTKFYKILGQSRLLVLLEPNQRGLTSFDAFQVIDLLLLSF